MLTDDEIRDLMIRHGFTVKPGQTDLKPYVYEAARAIEAAAISALAQERDTTIIGSTIERDVKNRLCIEGHTDAAMRSVILSGSPDETRAILTKFGHTAVDMTAAAERERCKRAVCEVKDRSGINADGQSWLQRASRSDFIAAIDRLSSSS